MNPWALVVIGTGIMLIIIGVKGTQHDIAGAVTGKNKSSGSQTGGTSGSTTTGTLA